MVCFPPLHPLLIRLFPGEGIDFPKKCAMIFLFKRLRRRHAFPVRFPERSLYAAMALFACRGRSPLPSRMGGNAMPGAPVTASMSDGSFCRNQGGTVEYSLFVSHP